MPILNRLVSLYEKRGIGIAAGFSPWRYANLPQVNFTWFLRNGKSLTNGLGIAPQEVYFLECLFEVYRPKTIFVIGNSWGWSTLALALLNPKARIVAIDAGFDENSLEGLAFTNRVATEEKLDIKVVKAVSPQDVPAVLKAEFAGPVDFSFVDGYHTKEQVYLDFAAVRPGASSDAVYLFHDVQEFNLGEGVARASAEAGVPWLPLEATTSGMAVLYDPARHPAIAGAIAPFRSSADARAVLAHEVYRATHRRRLKWRRSFDKRVRKLKELLGG
jgi:pimeloyl-ACP methyl ester carboxylesterase